MWRFLFVATSSALLPWLARIVWNRFLLLYWPARCLANQMKHGGIDEKVLALSSRNERVWSIFHQVDLVRPIGHTILVSLTARLETECHHDQNPSQDKHDPRPELSKTIPAFYFG